MRGRASFAHRFTPPTNLRLFACALGLFCSAASGLHAATLTVTTTNDSGPGSLRDALASATDGDTIDASGVSGTILLTNGELAVTNSVNIVGPGQNLLAIDANHASRVLYTGSNTTVSVSRLTIANGYASYHPSGGGISTEDSYPFGGGILAEGSLTVWNCTFGTNVADDRGGGLSLRSGVDTVSNCTFIGNFSIYGAGINNAGSLIIVNSLLSSNNADYGRGGGIYNTGGLKIINCTLYNNGAGYGGGLYDPGADVQIVNSTFSGNSASEGGGAIYGGGAGVLVANCTLSGNTAPECSTGGIGCYNSGAIEGGPMMIGNTVMDAGVSSRNIASVVTSLGYNLSSDDGGGFLTATGDQINTDPMLGPLQDNGGATPTHALLHCSPAIDKGKRDTIPALAVDTDQRGFPRPVGVLFVANASGGDGSDIGAFEVQSTFEDVMMINRQQANLNFTKPTADGCSINANLNLCAQFNPTGQTVHLDIGGAMLEFTLDSKGRASTARGVTPAGRIALAFNKSTGRCRLIAKLQKGSWQQVWATYGLLNTNIPNPGITVTLPVTAQIGDDVYSGSRMLFYISKTGKSGSAK